MTNTIGLIACENKENRLAITTGSVAENVISLKLSDRRKGLLESLTQILAKRLRVNSMNNKSSVTGTIATTHAKIINKIVFLEGCACFSSHSLVKNEVSKEL